MSGFWANKHAIRFLQAQPASGINAGRVVYDERLRWTPFVGQSGAVFKV